VTWGEPAIVVAQEESGEVGQLLAAGQGGGVAVRLAQVDAQQRQGRQPAPGVGAEGVGADGHPVEHPAAPLPVAAGAQERPQPLLLVAQQEVVGLALQVEAARAALRQAGRLDLEPDEVTPTLASFGQPIGVDQALGARAGPVADRLEEVQLVHRSPSIPLWMPPANHCRPAAPGHQPEAPASRHAAVRHPEGMKKGSVSLRSDAAFFLRGQR
jgi:hypothetical protein